MRGSDSGLRIRPARREDIPAIVLTANSSVSDPELAGFASPGLERTFADPGRLAVAWQEPNRVRGEEVIVAEFGGRVVAWVTVEDRGQALELVNIDVRREVQRRGIGTRLVRYVEERAREEGKDAVTLGTSRNAAGVPWKSLPWWLARGYRVTGEEENAWTRSIGAGVREIRMRKDIPRTGDVQLRDVLEEDLPVFFDQQRDPAANRMAAFTAKDPADRGAFMAHWKRILGDPSVTMKTILFQGDVVGSIGTFVEDASGRTEVTYWIGREYWGKGLATKALADLLVRLMVRPICARAARDNLASIRVLEKCGFTVIGYEREFANARGEEIEEVVLQLGPSMGQQGPAR